MILIIILIIILLALIYYAYPCFFKLKGYERWSVGIGRMKNLDQKIIPETIISHEEVKNITGMDFIADPFLIKNKGEYFLFVEAAKDNFGRIDVFSFKNIDKWKYIGTALSKEHHLSFPNIFYYEDKIYMIPETKKAGEVALYVPQDFPLRWEKHKVLLTGKFVDTTILFHEGIVYLFTYNSGKLRVYYNNSLFDGQFTEHPISPLGVGNRLRPAGAPFYKGDKIILPVQSRKKEYGYAVHELIIKKLNAEKLIYKKGGTLVKPLRNVKFFRDGVHTLNILKDDDSYMFVIDGRVGTTKAYWRNYCKKSIEDLVNDIKTFFIILKNNLRSRLS
jgi:hypothetical protein